MNILDHMSITVVSLDGKERKSYTIKPDNKGDFEFRKGEPIGPGPKGTVKGSEMLRQMIKLIKQTERVTK